MTLSEFREFCKEFPGYRLPSRKEIIRHMKAEFLKSGYRFDGNVPALAKRLGVSRQTVYCWTREKYQLNKKGA